MSKLPFLISILLAVMLLDGCTTSYTMTTRSGEKIETQGKPEADPSTGLTKYADTFGYHRTIQTSEIAQTSESVTHIEW